ncbi:Golgi to ER traffic protein 4 homolog [Geodia barretti]|uniref:Golgi to ER traffic protein 4 homolog n=1 Tax=Geodia barretti TaxID=519541 RepID=A0AA35TP69_GEOBA|nr:Golgi to ER traffic protein 4 homolog [Geodia barretti]
MAEKAASGPRPAGRPVSSRRSGRVEEKLKQKIRDKEYYEAHQTYRVLFQRYKAQGKENEALELVYNGALLLLQHGQLSSGSDLGMLLVQHLKDKKTPVRDELLEKIGILFGSYTGRTALTESSGLPETESSGAMDSTNCAEPAAPGVLQVIPEVDGREAFLRAALKWSNMVADEEQWKYGHPKLHKMAASTYWRERQYVKAREHFLYAEQPQEFGNMLVELAMTFGYSGEADLFIAQAVLQMLVLKDRKGGLAVFNTYTRKHPKFKTDNPPYLHHPTLNFVWFLLCACKDRSREVFQCLRNNYSPTINRDPSFNEYLDKIGEAWFAPPNQARPAGTTTGPSGGIFSGLGGTGGLLEGILNSISSVLPQAAGAAVSAAAAGGQGSSGPPPMNFTVPSSTGTTHIHVGTMPTPETAEPPHMGAYIGEIPFPFPGFPIEHPVWTPTS